MVQYCRKCGKELEDDAEFCDSCGFSLNDDPTKNNNTKSMPTQTENKVMENKSKNEFKNKLPLIAACLSIVLCFVECMLTPQLMGWDAILFALGIGIIGGIIGIYLMEKMDEPLIAAVEFIAAGALIFLCIARFGEISAALFMITGVLTLYLKGMYSNNKKLWCIPIITVLLILIILIAGGALSHINAENSVTVGNLSQNITNDGYGYYSGYITGDIKVDSSFDYLSVDVDFYDAEGKIITSNIGWNELNPESGHTYKISSWYFEQSQPVRAEIKVVDSAKSTTPLYSENITIVTGSEV